MAAKQETRPELTDKQREVLEFIRKFIKAKGWPPSMQEMADAMGLESSSGVMGHLVALERKGYIARETGQSRAIRIID